MRTRVTGVRPGPPDSVASVIRRLTMFAVTGLAVTGCATFTDNDVIARVDDVELTSDQLEERLNPAAGDSADGSSDGSATSDDGLDLVRVPGDVARESVATWIREQLIADTDLAAIYSAAPSDLGITCLDVAIALDETDADTIMAQLDSGASWDDVVAPIEEALGYESVQPCVSIDEYAERFGPEAAAAFAALKPADGPQIVDTGDGGFTVMRAQELDQAQLVEVLGLGTGGPPPQVVIDRADVDVDIYVDPRLGTFDHDRWVVDPVN